MDANEKVIAQRALDLLTELIDVTGASGKEPHNHIIGLKLIDRKGCRNFLGQALLNGEYVRPIWSDDPDRDDGYYDINVNGDSPWGAVCDVMKELKRRF
jgi:hypothetical protein